MTPVLQTERLSLRPPLPSDAERIAALVGDLAVSRWVTHVPHPYTIADSLDFIERFSKPEKRTYLVCRDDTIIGCMGLAGELGYWFGVDCWGQGFATEAARGLLATHFQTSDDDVASGYHLGNARSARVLEKLGFQPTHRTEATVAATGETVTNQRMRLSADTWRGTA